jgi:hypothetical protein
MLSTSSEFGGLFADGTGHKLALFYGMFFWSGVALYIGTVIVLRRERHAAPVPLPPDPDGSSTGLLRPHIRALRQRLHKAGSPRS